MYIWPWMDGAWWVTVRGKYVVMDDDDDEDDDDNDACMHGLLYFVNV